jgi:uncharacterized damage-inducible protein DinB
MNTLEFCVNCRKSEVPKSVKVLKAIPEKSDYRPDPKSRQAIEIAWLLARAETALLELIDTGMVEWKESPPPAKVAEVLKAFERDSEKVNERLAGLNDAAWQKKGKLMMGGQAWEDTIENMAWGFLFDHIHHRGQLTTYLRPMGGKVPAIYGPSADDSGQ